MAVLLIVAVIIVAFSTFCKFPLSREAKRYKEHRALVLKLRKSIARKRNRPRVLFIYKQEEVSRRRERV
jgi:hypothetical protein